MPKRILVVGGAKTLVFGNFKRNLEPLGVQVGWHVTDEHGDGGTFTTVPSGCEGVVYIAHMPGLRHAFYDKVDAEVRKTGLPRATVSRKWSKAEPVLRMQGILPPVSNEIEAWNLVQVKDDAIKYIAEEYRRGRVPKQDEVGAALQRAYGPKFALDPDLFRETLNRACAVAPKPTPIVTAPSGGSMPTREENLEWAITHIEEQPELAGDPEKLRVSCDMPLSVCQEAITLVRTRWRRVGGDAAYREQAQRVWMRNWFQRFKDTGADWPTNRGVLTQSKTLFGVMVLWEKVKEVRAQVLGDWTRELVDIQAAAEYLVQTYPQMVKTLGMLSPDVQPDVVRTLCQEGKLKAFKVNAHKWMTSTIAIDEFAAAQQTPQKEPSSARSPTPVAVPPVPAPPVASPPVPDTPRTFTREQVAELLKGVVAVVEVFLVRHQKEVFDRLDRLEEGLRARQDAPKATPKIPFSPEALSTLLSQATGGDLRLTFGPVSTPEGKKLGV